MSSPAPSVLQARNRAWHYWGTDGLFSMIQGLALLLLGLGSLLDHQHRRSTLAGVLILLGLVIQVDQVFFRKIVEWLKARITYPRTGYATPPQLSASRPGTALLSPADKQQLSKGKWVWLGMAVWIALFGCGAVTGHRWLFAAASVWIVFMLLHYGKRVTLVWYISLSILLCGALLTFLPTDLWASMAITIVVMAITIILIGAVTLSRYLKEHPAPPA